MYLQKKETILIVDDSKFQRAIIREMLGEHFHLEEATSGEECLMILEKSSHLIDLVLLDLVMPGIDGFEVLRRRQTMDAFKDIPVIVLTSSNSIEFQTEAFELGVDEFIIKPVDARIALSRINNTLVVKRRLQNSLDAQNLWKVKSQIDEMTSLFNKMTIENLVSETLTNAPSALHALMVIDIDNFKSANDIYGHTVGDHIICVIAGVISSQFRNTDFVGRIGGDEFVVLMPDIPAKEVAFEKAESLIQIILKKEGISILDNISISIGLAFSDSEDKTYASFFGKADQALYVSKKSGKGRYSLYGSDVEEPDDTNEVLIWSGSRNVLSMLEYALNYSASIVSVTSQEEICKHLADDSRSVLAIFADVSDTTDSGKFIWDTVKDANPNHICPVIAICREGSLDQIQTAVSSELIDDLLFSPLEISVLKRRIKASIHPDKNNEGRVKKREFFHSSFCL